MCEFCGNDKDIIFPFQLHKCQRCEGEHALLGAGPGGFRSPSPRPSIPHNWRDWKISKPRRLSDILSRDMREGEGGEEEASDKNKSGGMSQASADGSKFDVGEQEEAGGEKHEKGEEEGGGGHRRKVYRKLGAVLGDRRPWREGNLLKTLHIDRLKNSFSKGDSDSEGTESPEDTTQERKHFWNVPKLTVFTKSVPKKDRKDEGIKEEKKDREGRELAEDSKVSDKSPETGRSREENLPKLFRGQNMSLLSRGGTEEEEEDISGESEGKTEIGAQEGGATIITRKTWRGCKTRRAQRITRGREIRDQTERENKTGGGASTERVAGSSESGEGGECGQDRAVFQDEEG